MIRLLGLRSVIVATIAYMTLAGCAVGPDFRMPDVPVTQGYTQAPLPPVTASSQIAGGASQRFVPGQEIPDQWWTLFRSEPLDRLIRQALADSPTLAAAQATLRQAQENLRARTGTVYYPSLDGNFSAARQKVTGASSGQPNAASSTFTLFNASVNVSYTLDIFGGGRRELEALRAQVDYQRFQMEGAYLTLSANIVTTAIKEAALRAQLLALQEIIAIQAEQLEVVERQFQLGGVTRSDVLAQKAQLSQSKATLPPLEKELAQTRHQLSVYAGRLPSEAGLPEFTLDGLQLPCDLPLSLSSTLVRQRPDIRASEELLHAASAQVGVATANLYPQITLTGSLGSNASRIQDLFSTGSSVWGIAAGLLQPIFHGGELTAKRRAAIAAYDQALALYRNTVLQSFQNVADVLWALEADARTLQAQADAETAAQDSLNLTQRQFQVGSVSYLSLLNAQRQHQQALINVIQARAVRFADTAALFQSLGGGWWNRTPQADTVTRTDTK